MKLVIAVCSGFQFQKRRMRCLKTWVPTVPPREDFYFYLGVPYIETAERHGYLVFLPCPNNYNYLPLRTKRLCQYAIQDDWDWLFKTDDDVRLDVDRLRTFCLMEHGFDYAGAAVDDRGGQGYPLPRIPVPGMKTYASGNGYLLSRKACKLIAESTEPDEGNEDMMVGRIMRENGIPLLADKRFHIFAGKDEAPGPDNDWIYSSPNDRGDF